MPGDTYDPDMTPEAEGQHPIVLTGDEDDVAVYPDQTPAPLGDEED